MIRVLVCGGRDYTDRAKVNAFLDNLWVLNGDLAIIEGEAPGADSFARDWAILHGQELHPFPALWDRYGKAAGPIRNQQMLDEGQPDLVAFFHADLERSKGTRDMVKRAERRGILIVNGEIE